MSGFESFLQDKAWLGFFAYLVVKEAWPFFRDRVWPRKIAEANAERDRLKQLEERSNRSEERQTVAVENMSLSVQQMALAITTNNERLSTLISSHAEHTRFTQEAIADMRQVAILMNSKNDSMLRRKSDKQ